MCDTAVVYTAFTKVNHARKTGLVDDHIIRRKIAVENTKTVEFSKNEPRVKPKMPRFSICAENSVHCDVPGHQRNIGPYTSQGFPIVYREECRHKRF